MNKFYPLNSPKHFWKVHNIGLSGVTALNLITTYYNVCQEFQWENLCSLDSRAQGSKHVTRCLDPRKSRGNPNVQQLMLHVEWQCWLPIWPLGSSMKDKVGESFKCSKKWFATQLFTLTLQFRVLPQFQRCKTGVAVETLAANCIHHFGTWDLPKSWFDCCFVKAGWKWSVLYSCAWDWSCQSLVFCSGACNIEHLKHSEYFECQIIS